MEKSQQISEYVKKLQGQIEDLCQIEIPLAIPEQNTKNDNNLLRQVLNNLSRYKLNLVLYSESKIGDLIQLYGSLSKPMMDEQDYNKDFVTEVDILLHKIDCFIQELTKLLTELDNNLIIEQLQYIYELFKTKSCINDDGILLHFATTPQLANIRFIELSESCTLREDEFSTFLSINETRQYERLIFRGCKSFNVNLLRLLLQSYTIMDCKYLDISNTSIKGELLPSGNQLQLYSGQSHLQHLNVSGNSGINDKLIEVLESSNLSFPKLKELNFKSTSVTSKGIHILANSQKFPRIENLNLSGLIGIDDEAIKQIIESNRTFQNLNNLVLTGTRVTSNGITQLITSTLGSNLTTLILSSNYQIGDAMLVALSTSQYTTNLQVLDVRATSVTSQGINKYVNSINCMQLLEFNFSECESVKDEAIYSIINSTHLNLLRKLEVQGTSITSKSINEFIKSPKFQFINEFIAYSFEKLKDDSINSLAKSIYTQNLRVLNISNTNITSNGFGSWPSASPQSLTSLQELLVYNQNSINDEVLSLISNTKTLSNLNFLNLMKTGITDQAIRFIAQSFYMVNLRQLNLQNNKNITTQTLFYLGADNCQIQLWNLNLRGTTITDDGLVQYFNSSKSRNLVKLNISQCPGVNDLSLQALGNSVYCKNLRQLNISQTNITSKGIQYICESVNLVFLTELDLLDLNNIDDNALIYLQQSTTLPSLSTVDLTGSSVSSSHVDNLIKAKKFISEVLY